MLRIDSYNDDTYDYICEILGDFLRQHRIIIAYKPKAPSPKAECVEKHSIFIARVH